MNDSWIALADQYSLKLLVLETKHAACFAMRRAERENTVCFWVVLEPTHAHFVNQQLRLGNAADALRLLEYFAIDMGRIASTESLIPTWLPDDVTISEDHDMEWTS